MCEYHTECNIGTSKHGVRNYESEVRRQGTMLQPM